MLTDLPLDGLRAASRRLRSERVSGAVVAASGDALAAIAEGLLGR